ncbi:VOC family protein [Paracoccus sp. (in: a-proteobacteria)]|uniref:VOC family protein n=1 Tax=Paracoccus sp. TaxID=267 RepID=UPI0028A0FFE8|nr:VOC family protein [Paracoccus sp. (in: a-proteobacteria)]
MAHEHTPPLPPSQLALLEIAIYAQNLEECAAFWANVMGLREISRQAGRHVFFHAGNQVLLIFDPRSTDHPPRADAPILVPPHGTQGAGHLCFAVNDQDMDKWRVYLEGAGVAIEADFIWPQGGRSIYFRDPAGNSIELADPRIWQKI